MTQSTEVREQIRHVLEEMSPVEPQMIDRVVDRIMDVVDPFRQTAIEELERFRPTFDELAK
jgi:hypothetical protein